MRLDFLADPALSQRYTIVSADTGEPIEDIAWADPDAGIYATIKSRPRTFADPLGTDLRIRSGNGNFALQIHQGEIEVVDREVNPFKAELMALLDDPEVVEKIRKISQNTL